MTLPENLLHFIWKYRLYQKQAMRTASGKSLTVLNGGMHNSDAGADFQSAKIRIDNTEWAGNVEIHKRSSDWEVHRHHEDRAYNNVILHVVYEHDKSVSRADGTTLETLELKHLVPHHVLLKYREMMNGMCWIPCEKHIHTVSSFQLSQWLSRLLIERFEHRVKTVYDLLEQHRGSWEDTCYVWMARCFGFHVNAQAFEQLARAVPGGLIAKYEHRPLAVEALFFGQSGMLEEEVFKDEYPLALQKEYAYLRKLHSLWPLDETIWKFMRTRPANFPSMRIAQFAAFRLRFPHVFSVIVNTMDNAGLMSLFKQLPVNGYWRTHYRFDVSTTRHGSQPGQASLNTLLINAVSVLLFAYGKYIDKEAYIYRAISLLESLKPEDNAIIRRFSALGIHANQAGESQALLQMKSCYCDRKRCLNCGVGLEIIKYKEG